MNNESLEEENKDCQQQLVQIEVIQETEEDVSTEIVKAMRHMTGIADSAGYGSRHD